MSSSPFTRPALTKGSPRAQAALGAKGPAKPRTPPRLPRPGPAGASPAPQKQPPGTRRRGTAHVPRLVQSGWPGCVAERGGRKPTTLSTALPLGHNCSSIGAKGRLKFRLQRRHPLPCFVSISLQWARACREGARNNPPSLLEGLILEPSIL